MTTWPKHCSNLREPTCSDLDAELARLQGEAEKLKKHIEGSEKKLANKNFVDRAPVDVVEGVKDTLAGLQKQLQSVQDSINQLSEQ